MKFLRFILLFSLALMANNSNALVMPAVGSALVIDKTETLYVNDGDVFDLASFNITSNGNLSIYGNTPDTTFSILTTGNFILDGYLNLFVSKIFVESENITIAGTVKSVGEVNLTAQTSIFLAAGSVFNADSLNAQVPAVPENEIYAMLLMGFGIISVTTHRR